MFRRFLEGIDEKALRKGRAETELTATTVESERRRTIAAPNGGEAATTRSVEVRVDMSGSESHNFLLYFVVLPESQDTFA